MFSSFSQIQRRRYQCIFANSKNWCVGFQVNFLGFLYNFQASYGNIFGVTKAKTDKIQHFEGEVGRSFRIGWIAELAELNAREHGL